LGKRTPVARRDEAAALCPCGRGAAYEACCGRWHHGPLQGQAPSAEALMRSRYSAFVLDELAYLLDTWHATTRPASLDANAPDVKWLGLDIKKASTTDPAHAEVTFVARHRVHGKAYRLHETSRFVKEQGRWFYVDGDIHT